MEDTERLQTLKESLKSYVLLKESRFLNRERKLLSPEETYVCECVPSQEAHGIIRYAVWLTSDATF